MCTATWLSQAQGYELFFSRDEARERASAHPPKEHLWEGARALAPIDGAAGGTWLAVNEYGLALCLLNASSAYGPLDPESPEREPRSRGLLVRDLASCASEAQVRERLGMLELERYRGFRLACFTPPDAGRSGIGFEVRVWSWDGASLEAEAVRQPLASSSLGSERAHRTRGAALETFLGRSETDRAGAATGLEAFHRSHEPQPGPWSVCVHRSDVATLSLCHVRVDAERVGLRYAAGSPCESAFGPEVTLARRAVRPIA